MKGVQQTASRLQRQSATQVRGDSCDPDELCPGSIGGVCPADTVTAAGTTCRTGSGDLCDPDEECTGFADEACPTDSFAPSGTACDDDVFCFGPDTCDGSGTCTRPVRDCDDINECTEDTCDETGDTCVNDSFCDMSGRALYNEIVTGPADSPNLLNPIDDVDITLTGDGAGSTATANDGTYSFVDEAGSVTVTPSRAATEDDVDLALSASDASLISMASVGLEPFTPKQFEAGDVSNNGALSSFDAALVSQRAVDIITTFSTLGGASWFFVPTASTEDVTTGSAVTDIDFCGVIYGDVTMNWTGPTTLDPAKSATPAESTEFGDLHASWQNIDPRQVRQMIIDPSLEARIYVAQGLREQDDGSYEMVLGLSQSDGILGLDLSLQYDPDSVSIESLTRGRLARSFQLDSRQFENGTHGVSLFSPIPMQGTGEFPRGAPADQWSAERSALRGDRSGKRRCDPSFLGRRCGKRRPSQPRCVAAARGGSRSGGTRTELELDRDLGDRLAEQAGLDHPLVLDVPAGSTCDDRRREGGCVSY